MQTEPLPCPFCGYRAHAVQAQPEIRQEEWVTCLSCFTEITGDGAIARWNTRVEPDARIAELTKAYVSELDELAERNYKLRFELAALKAKPRNPACSNEKLAEAIKRLRFQVEIGGWFTDKSEVNVRISDLHDVLTRLAEGV